MPLRKTQESSGRPLADSGLRCPACEYNLTGVVENRCPECGTAFNREQLLAMLAGEAVPIPVWDDVNQDRVLRFIKICLFTWFYPTKVGRMFPRQYLSASALRFHWTVVVVTALGYLAALAPTLGLVGLFAVLAIGLPVLVGVLLCELALAGIFGYYLRGDAGVVPRFKPGVAVSWEGLVGFFRSFLLLQAIVLGAGAMLDLLPGMHVWFAALWIALLVVPVWWWIALASAIAVQRAGSGAKLAAIVTGTVLAGAALLVAWIFFSFMV